MMRDVNSPSAVSELWPAMGLTARHTGFRVWIRVDAASRRREGEPHETLRMDRRPARTHREKVASPISRPRRTHPLKELRPESRRRPLAGCQTRVNRPWRLDRPRSRRHPTRRSRRRLARRTRHQTQNPRRIRIAAPLTRTTRIRGSASQPHLAGHGAGMDRRHDHRGALRVTDQTSQTSPISPLQLAVNDGILARDPTSGVKVPTVRRREQRFLTAEQVTVLAAAAENAQTGTGLIIETLAWVGMRWGELVALRRPRVHLLRRRIEIAESATELGSGLSWGTPKTHERRLVTMPAFLADRLAAHLGTITDDGLVFTAPKGGPLRSSPFRQTVWKPAIEAADLEQLRIHDLRGTAASLMISTGANIKAVQRQLGHASAAMTLDLYGHLYDRRPRRPLRRARPPLHRRHHTAPDTPPTRLE